MFEVSKLVSKNVNTLFSKGNTKQLKANKLVALELIRKFTKKQISKNYIYICKIYIKTLKDIKQ